MHSRCSPCQFFFFFKFQVRILFTALEVPTLGGVPALWQDQHQLPPVPGSPQEGRWKSWTSNLVFQLSFCLSSSPGFLMTCTFFLPHLLTLLVYTPLSVLPTDHGYWDLILNGMISLAGFFKILFSPFSYKTSKLHFYSAAVRNTSSVKVALCHTVAENAPVSPSFPINAARHLKAAAAGPTTLCLVQIPQLLLNETLTFYQQQTKWRNRFTFVKSHSRTRFITLLNMH